MRRHWTLWLNWQSWTIGVEKPFGRDFVICLGPLLIARMSEFEEERDDG